MTLGRVWSLHQAAGETHTSGAMQGPPRRTGCIPLPELRSNLREGGRREATQGGCPLCRVWVLLGNAAEVLSYVHKRIHHVGIEVRAPASHDGVAGLIM